jgi:uncharacterized protein YbbC (DUF1343 family)
MEVMRGKRGPQSFLLAGLLLAASTCATSGEDAEGEGDPAGGAESASTAQAVPVRPGIEVLLSDSLHLVRGLRVGLITNHTGIDRHGVPSIDRLMEAPEVDLVALYSPEHGIRGTEEAGNRVESGRDQETGLPIHSLYGETLKPTPEMLEGVEALLFDIQDVGARYYTYVSTMARGMEAAGEAGIPFVVLDRPNPIGGEAVQGTVLDPAFSTFVGLYPVPMRHGMTVGELARMMVGEFGVLVDLKVVPAEGWRRGMIFPETGLPWVPPSPNMPSVESALHYPGTCLFEGTNLSVGRGTDEAFQVVGAPWLDGEALAAALTAYQIPGVRFEATRFTPRDPGDGKYGGEEIPGIRLWALRPDYDPTLAALALLREIRDVSAGRWEWRVAHFDRLAGTDRLRAGIDAGSSVEELRSGWDEGLRDFAAKRERYLIYPE